MKSQKQNSGQDKEAEFSVSHTLGETFESAQHLLIWSPPGYEKTSQIAAASEHSGWNLLHQPYLLAELKKQGPDKLIKAVMANIRKASQTSSKHLILISETHTFKDKPEPFTGIRTICSALNQALKHLSKKPNTNAKGANLKIIVTTSLCANFIFRPEQLESFSLGTQAKPSRFLNTEPWSVLGPQSITLNHPCSGITQQTDTPKTNQDNPHKKLLKYYQGWPCLYQLVQHHNQIQPAAGKDLPTPLILHALQKHWIALRDTWLTSTAQRLAVGLSLLGKYIPESLITAIISDTPTCEPEHFAELAAKGVLLYQHQSLGQSQDSLWFFCNDALVEMLQMEFKNHPNPDNESRALVNWISAQTQAFGDERLGLQLYLNQETWGKAIDCAAAYASNKARQPRNDPRFEPWHLSLLHKIPKVVHQQDERLKKLLSFEVLLQKISTPANNNTRQTSGGITSWQQPKDRSIAKIQPTYTDTKQASKQFSDHPKAASASTIASRLSNPRYTNTGGTGTEHDINFHQLHASDKAHSASLLIDATNYIQMHQIKALMNTALKMIQLYGPSNQRNIDPLKSSNGLMNGMLALFYATWQSGDFELYQTQVQALNKAVLDNRSNQYLVDSKLLNFMQISQDLLTIESAGPDLHFTYEQLPLVEPHSKLDLCLNALLARINFKTGKLAEAGKFAKAAQDQQYAEASYLYTQLFSSRALEFDLLFKAGKISEALSLIKPLAQQPPETLPPRATSQLAFYKFINEANPKAFDSGQVLFSHAKLNMSLCYHLCLQAVAHFLKNKNKASLKYLKIALNNIEPLPYRTLVFDTGPSMSYLILYASQKGFNHPLMKQLMPVVQAQVDKGELCLELLNLSKRETEILALINSGFSNEDIANQICRSIGTVKLHVHSVYKKLDINTRVQAIKKCQKQGFFGLYLQ